VFTVFFQRAATAAESDWRIAVCDRCAQELRVRTDDSIHAQLMMLNEMDAHDAAHPTDTKESLVADNIDIGEDELVEPLAGALGFEDER